MAELKSANNEFLELGISAKGGKELVQQILDEFERTKLK